MCRKTLIHFFLTKNFFPIQNLENSRSQSIFHFYGNTSADYQGAWLGKGQNSAIFLTTDLFILTTKFRARENDYFVIFRKYKAF